MPCVFAPLHYVNIFGIMQGELLYNKKGIFYG